MSRGKSDLDDQNKIEKAKDLLNRGLFNDGPAMFEPTFEYRKKVFFLCVDSGLYSGYLMYTSGDGVLTSEFGLPVKSSNVAKLLRISQTKTKMLMMLTPRSRMKLYHVSKVKKVQ
jgi:hypothetical protein